MAGDDKMPGFTAAFDAFLGNAVAKPVILLVADTMGRRSFLRGRLLPEPRNESLVALGRLQAPLGAQPPPLIVPRRDVVAWYGGTDKELAQLVVSLELQGYVGRSAA